MNNRIKKITIVGGGSAGWMAAATLATYLGKASQICLVESEEIGIVGVGEASVPHIRQFNGQWLGIEETEFVRRTQATAKLGIQFKDWGKIGDSYVHGFGAIGRAIGPLPFHQFWLKLFLSGRASPIGDYSPQTVMAPRNKFVPRDHRATADSPFADIAYAYHFDATLYARYLREIAEQRGVQRFEGKVVAVKQSQANGHENFVEAVVLENGQVIEGDLFIDCSGFRGLLIEETLKTGYHDWSHWLPCDRAQAVPSESVNPLTPYTRATAQAAGWQWRIPLQHRVGNGYVYCSKHISDDEANATLLRNLDGKALAEPRLLRFTTGMRKQFWNKNVIAIGLAGGFLEPLESTSIYLAQTGITRLLSLFPHQDFDPELRQRYNNETAFEYERVRDFLILHYHATQRDDSPFWNHCRTMEIPESLRAAISLFRKDGRYFRHGEDFFALPSWVQVMLGQGIIPQHYHPIVDEMPEDRLIAQVEGMRDLLQHATASMPTHAEWVERYWRA
ncbi:MAG: tryptophan 7-halogenase [Burkholderiaceae bacterium]|nr:MAG: tryptophan 7-halogenase [Burkholderiaceae bacterium]